MFVACEAKTGRLLNLLEKAGAVIEGAFLCPACQGPVCLKQGPIMRPHFAHRHLAACQYMAENESAQHLTLKAQLYSWASQTCQVSLETHLPQLGQTADLLLNQRLVLEVQCSSLSITRLRERTQAYQRKGYPVRWLLGQDLWLQKRLTRLQCQFLYFSQNMGFHLWELDSERAELRLKYLIHEDLRGRARYLTRVFPFGQGDLLTVLRQPFAQQRMPSWVVDLEASPQTYVRQQLYYRHPKWMARQAHCYEQGDNLLTWSPAAFYPQVRPITSSTGFVQIETDLKGYYQAFEAYYQQLPPQNQQQLYPPAFYLTYQKNQINNGKS